MNNYLLTIKKKYVSLPIIFLYILIINTCQINHNNTLDHNDKFINYGLDRTIFYFIKEFNFPPLLEEEGFLLEINTIDDFHNLDTIYIIRTTNGKELFRFQEKRFSNWNVPYIDINDRYLFFDFFLSDLTIESIDIHHLQPTGVCIINGNTGNAKIFYISTLYYGIDNNAKYICVYDYFFTVPRITIYNLETLRILNRIEYEEYRDKLMYPKEIFYNNNSFLITLSADTAEFAKIRMPIYGINTYYFIEGFSYDD